MSKRMPWFRAYTEMIDDEKLRLLAFEDRWHFVALLCLKGQGVLDESDKLLFRKVAVKLGVDLRTLEEIARRLAEVGLIDEKTLQPIAWESRQFQSDSSAERTRAYRERMKRHSDVTVTPQETDTETDTDKEEEKRESSPPATQSSRTPKATRLPSDWSLPPDWAQWALTEHPSWTPDGVRKVADSFRDYWTAKGGADARKADWAATWRNWVRREKSPPMGAPSRASQHADWNAQMNALVSRSLGQPEMIDMGVIDASE